MQGLLELPEINGTCWVEFNVSGSQENYEPWQASSRYASLDAMYEIYSVFSLCFERFDLYGPPIFIEPTIAIKLSKMLDVHSSVTSSRDAKHFSQELGQFLNDSAKSSKPIWMLGV